MPARTARATRSTATAAVAVSVSSCNSENSLATMNSAPDLSRAMLPPAGSVSADASCKLNPTHFHEKQQQSSEKAQLPAKRSLSDRIAADGKDQDQDAGAPPSPGRATRSHRRPDAVPASPPRNTRAARASARAQATRATAKDGSGSPRSSKRAKLDHDDGGDSDTAANTDADTSPISKVKEEIGESTTQDVEGDGEEGISTPPTSNKSKTSSATSVAEVPPPDAAASAAAARPQSPPPPLKSLTMQHLRKKYLQELEYMSVEFRKLEKQLVGARGGGGGNGEGSSGDCSTAPSAANTTTTESPASRERREKLHSFIVHLEDTIQQIKDGCKAESDAAAATSSTTDGDVETTATADEAANDNDNGNDAAAATDTAASSKAKRDFADSAALTKLTREKEQEETVQKLEEHILANLLPVKVRLTKQLAAQQGATRNPAGMPTSARGPRPSAAAISGGKGTFAAAAEERRKREEAARGAAARGAQQDSSAASSSSSAAAAAAESTTNPPLQPPSAPSILGKPLKGGGSSLTARLHGATLGSKSRTAGHGVGQAEPAVQSPRSPRNMTKVASTTTEDSFDSTAGESGQPPKRKILFAGMTPGSEQVSSSVSAAQGAHKMVVTDPTLRAAHRAALASEAIEEGAGTLASLSSTKAPPPPPPPRGTKARPNHPGAPKTSFVVTSSSDSSNDTIAARGASTRSSTEASKSTPVPAGPASAAVAKVQAQQVATAAQLAARAKARAAAGLPPLDTPVTSSAAAELRRTGKKSTANRGKKRQLSEKNLTDEEKERLVRRRDRRQRRRKKAKRLERERIRHAAFVAQARHAQAQHSAAAVAAAAAAVAEQNKADPSKQGGAGVKGSVSKSSGSPSSDKKAGPRTVEYICGLCNEGYVSSCDANPWWCLRQQDCPKCGKRQVPRIDISAPANSIEYHPALLAHAEDSSSGGSGGGASVALRPKGPVASAYISAAHLAPPPKFPDLSELYETESEASDDDEAVSLGGESSDESDYDDDLKAHNGNLSPAERAEAEDFGTEYAGLKLKDNEASRLLVLMGHAQCCPGR